MDLREFSAPCPQIKLQEGSNNSGSEVAESDEFRRGPISCHKTSVENRPVAGSSGVYWPTVA